MMDLTVLDIGLRNHQISSVQCFFKIQTETFALKQSNESLSDKERDRQYEDWRQVFLKLINVISVNIKDKNFHNFAVCLSRIGFQSSNRLLKIVKYIDFNSIQYKTRFIELFVSNIRSLRRAIKLSNVEEFNSSEEKHFRNFDWNQRSTETQVLSESIQNNCLVLGQYWLKKHRIVDNNWSFLVKKVIDFAIKCLESNDLNNFTKILNQTGVDSKEIIENIYLLTSDPNIRQILITKFSEFIVLNKNLNQNLLEIIDELKRETNICLTIDWITRMTDTSLQRCFFLSFLQTKVFDVKSLSLSPSPSPQIVSNYLIDRNDCHSLNLWIQSIGSDLPSDSFPFDWELKPNYIEAIEERLSLTVRESLLNSLAMRGYFCSQESSDFQLILYRFGRTDSSVSMDSSNGFLKKSLILKNSSLRLKDFLNQLIEYICELKLNEFLYNYFKKFNRITISSENNLIKLLKTSIRFYEKPSNHNILENILMTAQYVYCLPNSVTVESLIESNYPYLGLICATFSSSSIYDIFSQTIQSKGELKRSEIFLINSFKSNFPILMDSLIDCNLIPSDCMTCEAPTVYSLLMDSIPFDVTKMFCWQSMNNLVEVNQQNIKSMVFNQLPHFSNTNLANLYGLKANLSFSYYLNQSRVVEAYHQFISNKKALNSKIIEMAGRKAALVAYNDTTDIQVAVSAIIFQQLLDEDSTQTLVHLSVANIIMCFASDFLSLNPKLQQTELSNLLKRSHYYSDKRAATKLLQLTVTAITRKYKNYMNIQIEECFDWKVIIKFATLHNLELPLDLLIKCSTSDNWLLFAICCQLHQYPKESVFAALKHFNNECISDHLFKAFQSSHTILTNSESVDNSRILNRKSDQKRTTKHLRNVLYDRIGLNRKPEPIDNNNRILNNRTPLRMSSSPTEGDDKSIASETDYNGIETISMVSSSNQSDGEDIPKLDPENCPKDLFQIILSFQIDSSTDSRKALMYSSIPLSNPILCLIASSVDYDSQKLDIFSCFSSWVLASVDFEVRKQFCQRVMNFDAINWSLENSYQLLDLITRDINNYSVFLRGIKIFNLNIPVVISLLKFMSLFFCEKNYYNVSNLKAFQDNLWKYEEPTNCENLFFTKQWIQRISVIILTNALRNAKNHELMVLLRHYDFARIQDSFSDQIKVEDFRKLYRLSQCLVDTNIVLPISEILSDDINAEKSGSNDERYINVINKVISSLQQNGHYSEARNIAKIAEIESKDLITNEWSLRAKHNLNSFEFWEKCWDSLISIDPSLHSGFKVFHKFLSQISSLVVKCFSIFKCMIASQHFEDQKESNLLETMLWKCVIKIENNYETNQIWSRIWSDIIVFIKSNRNKNLNTFDGMSSNMSSDEHKTIDKVMEKLLNNSCIEKAQEISHLFNHNHQDLDIVITCDSLAKGLIKQLSEAPLSVQLKTKAIGQIKVSELNIHFTEEQKQIIEFIENISSLSTIGRKACQRILLYFKISCILNQNYIEIESSEMDELELLRCLVSVHSPTNDALSFAKQLIVLNEISDENIASIICRETLISLKNSPQDYDNQRDNSFSNLMEMSTSFLSLVRLLDDPTILGVKLLHESDSLCNDSNNNSILTKLYIKAHECFSLSCDVKGIALVLRKTRLFITQNLLQLRTKEEIRIFFKSILTLMTGIGRYSEMTYCFDLFKENNEFELLFSKHIEKAPQLRIALLDYLKGDKELFPLVALRFCLYREIGENHEMSAKQQFNDLKYKLTTNLMNQKQQIENIMDELIDAHESYSKAGCHKKADTCGKLARLLALQIHYLPNNVVLINMNNNQIENFIENNRNFHESLIVAEAYEYNTNWVTPLFNHFILNNDSNYLSDFTTRRDISSSFVEELVNKYIQFVSQKNLTNERVIQMRKSIQRLIQYIDDYELRFRIASKLNFSQITHQMLSEESGSYLQDLRRNGFL